MMIIIFQKPRRILKKEEINNNFNNELAINKKRMFRESYAILY